MQPEKGNPEILVDEDVVCDAFRRAGVGSGDTILIHGSLSSMGWVQGGPPCIFTGILAASAGGTGLCRHYGMMVGRTDFPECLMCKVPLIKCPG